jgi:hypothetical protein
MSVTWTSVTVAVKPIVSRFNLSYSFRQSFLSVGLLGIMDLPVWVEL